MERSAVQQKKPAYAGVYNRFVKRLLDILISGMAVLVF